MLKRFKRYGKIAYRMAKGLHYTILVDILAFIILMGVMLGINLAGASWINWLFAIVGVVGVLAAGFKPKLVLWAFGLGALVKGLQDEDITQGSVAGGKLLYRIIMGTAYYFLAVSVLLAAVSFQGNPSSFFYIVAAGGITLFSYAAEPPPILRRAISVGTALLTFVAIATLLWGWLPESVTAKAEQRMLTYAEAVAEGTPASASTTVNCPLVAELPRSPTKGCWRIEVRPDKPTNEFCPAVVPKFGRENLSQSFTYRYLDADGKLQNKPRPPGDNQIVLPPFSCVSIGEANKVGVVRIRVGV